MGLELGTVPWTREMVLMHQMLVIYSLEFSAVPNKAWKDSRLVFYPYT